MEETYIVLVEDNPDDAFLASRIIGKACEHKVLLARDGEEALALLERMAADGSCRRIRLVLLDLKLPKISGLDLLQTVRGDDMLHTLPVAILTSSDNELDQEKSRHLRVLDYIYKPMTVERLQQVLNRIEES